MESKQFLRLLKHRAKRDALMLRSRLRLKRLDGATISNDRDELRLFAMGRNEALRLPSFIEHYLNAGVDRIFYIDNNSTDESREIAAGYPQVHSFLTTESFTHYSNWMEALLDKYGTGHWCIAADIDEILNFPHAETVEVKQLCRYLENEGAGALQAFLLDMYADKSTEQLNYQPGQSALEVCPYFDTEFEQSVKTWTNMRTLEKYECTKFTGNMRQRVFGLETSLSKVPLFHYGPGVFPARGMHAMDGVRFSEVRGAVFHFKYLQDFDRRVAIEATRGQHEGGAREYKRYAQTVAHNDQFCPLFEGSCRYEDTAQLVRLGIMKSSDAYDAYVDGLKSNRSSC